MRLALLLTALGIAVSAHAQGQGRIVFDRGVKLDELSHILNLQSPSVLFTIDPALDPETANQEPALPVQVPGTRDGNANLMASWFPDRNTLVYVSNRNSDNRAQIWKVDLSTGIHTRLTNNLGHNLWPVVSPGGEKIAFVSTIGILEPEETDEEENVVDGDEGTSKEDGTGSGGLTPDQNFQLSLAVNLDLYVMNANGTNVRRLTKNSWREENPVFSTDGSEVYYVEVGGPDSALFPILRRMRLSDEIGADMPIRDLSGKIVQGTDLSVFGDSLGDTFCYNDIQGVYTFFDAFTMVKLAGPTGLVRPWVSQDEEHAVSVAGGNLAVVNFADGESRSLLLTGDVRFARWKSPGEAPLPRVLKVLSPNGGEIWPKGATKTIKWESSLKVDDSIKIELSRGGLSPIVIVASTENDGEYDWTIPDTLVSSGDYVITVSFKNHPDIYDNSDSTFRIVFPQDCPVPAVPSNVLASDGRADRIVVIWDAVPGAKEYLVFRNKMLNSWSTATLVATTTETNYQDLDTIPVTVTQGCAGPQDIRTTYYYFIRASNDCGLSAFSKSDSGYRGKSEGVLEQAGGDLLLLGMVVIVLAASTRVRGLRGAAWGAPFRHPR